jgi:hypothetical protein
MVQEQMPIDAASSLTLLPWYVSTAHSTAYTDIRDDRVFENVAVSIVFEQLAEQLAKAQALADEAIEMERLNVCKSQTII